MLRSGAFQTFARCTFFFINQNFSPRYCVIVSPVRRCDARKYAYAPPCRITVDGIVDKLIDNLSWTEQCFCSISICRLGFNFWRGRVVPLPWASMQWISDRRGCSVRTSRAKKLGKLLDCAHEEDCTSYFAKLVTYSSYHKMYAIIWR